MANPSLPHGQGYRCHVNVTVPCYASVISGQNFLVMIGFRDSQETLVVPMRKGSIAKGELFEVTVDTIGPPIPNHEP